MALQDDKIIDLFWDRNEQAITETTNKYQRYLMKVSMNILFDEEDSQENCNDTYLKAWNSMPPHKPDVLSLFLGRIARDGAIDIYRKKHSLKRGASQYAQCLDELEEVVSGQESVDDQMIAKELTQAINRFLETLPAQKRNAFLGRYYYADSMREIASYTGMSEANVKVTLHRVRRDLKAYLEKEGYTI